MKIIVKIRRCTKPESKIDAFADVVLELAEGKLQLNSLSVFKPNGKPAWIAPPALKGNRKFFPHYSLSGDLRERVEAAVFEELEKQLGGIS